MNTINDKDKLLQIQGGALNVSGAILNAFKGCTNTIMDIGRSLGNSLRRIIFGQLCRI